MDSSCNPTWNLRSTRMLCAKPPPSLQSSTAPFLGASALRTSSEYSGSARLSNRRRETPSPMRSRDPTPDHRESAVSAVSFCWIRATASNATVTVISAASPTILHGLPSVERLRRTPSRADVAAQRWHHHRHLARCFWAAASPFRFPVAGTPRGQSRRSARCLGTAITNRPLQTCPRKRPGQVPWPLRAGRRLPAHASYRLSTFTRFSCSPEALDPRRLAAQRHLESIQGGLRPSRPSATCSSVAYCSMWGLKGPIGPATTRLAALNRSASTVDAPVVPRCSPD